MNIYILKDNHTTIAINPDPVKGRNQVLDYCAKVNYTDGTLFIPTDRADDPAIKSVNLIAHPAQTIFHINEEIDRFFLDYKRLEWYVKPCPFCSDPMEWIQSIRQWELQHKIRNPGCPIGHLHICDDTRKQLQVNWNVRK